MAARTKESGTVAGRARPAAAALAALLFAGLAGASVGWDEDGFVVRRRKRKRRRVIPVPGTLPAAMVRSGALR